MCTLGIQSHVLPDKTVAKRTQHSKDFPRKTVALQQKFCYNPMRSAALTPNLLPAGASIEGIVWGWCGHCPTGVPDRGDKYMLHWRCQGQVTMLGRSVRHVSRRWVGVLMMGCLLAGWCLPAACGQELTGGMKLIMEELRAVK